MSRDSEVIAARRVKALAGRLRGVPYRALAEELKVSLETAYSDVQAELRALREISKDDAEELLELELKRIDEAMRLLWPRIRKGDPKSVMAFVRLSERRSKLLGLDAPARHEHTGKNGAAIQVTTADPTWAFLTDEESVLMTTMLEAAAARAAAAGQKDAHP